MRSLLKIFEQNKNENFEQSHSAENSEKRGTFWDFLTFVLLQNIKKNERTFWGHLNLIVPKNVKTFCFGKLVKKISAYPRVRTRNLWVEKQASYH